MDWKTRWFLVGVNFNVALGCIYDMCCLVFRISKYHDDRGILSLEKYERAFLLPDGSKLFGDTSQHAYSSIDIPLRACVPKMGWVGDIPGDNGMEEGFTTARFELSSVERSPTPDVDALLIYELDDVTKRYHKIMDHLYRHARRSAPVVKTGKVLVVRNGTYPNGASIDVVGKGMPVIADFRWATPAGNGNLPIVDVRWDGMTTDLDVEADVTNADKCGVRRVRVVCDGPYGRLRVTDTDSGKAVAVVAISVEFDFVRHGFTAEIWTSMGV